MGKVEDEASLSSSSTTQIPVSSNAENNPCRKIYKFFHLKCLIALIFGVAVLLPALFWFPPFFQHRNRSDLDLEVILRAHKAVASFKLPRPVSMLNANMLQLQADILDEIGVPNSMVTVVALIPSAVSNTTIVVFAVVPDVNSSEISSASLSLLKSTFVSLVLHQSYLHLSPSLFGIPRSFEVLKFEGGITVTPQQSAFLLQKVQSLFNFTLNFSIHVLQENFEELKDQLKSGLHLTIYENLYVSLKNSNGSTAAPPTTVQASVLLAIGNLPPPLPRLKQLAQTITGSPARNLGLDHTEFGKVKQVRLSSVLQHSLNSGGSGTSGSPSSSPMPQPNHQHQHHHHHHHRHSQEHHHHDIGQAPAPAPRKRYHAKPPSACRNGIIGKNHGEHHKSLGIAPVGSPHHSASPHSHVDPPAPSSHRLPPPALSPSVPFSHAYSPRGNRHDIRPPEMPPTISPSSSSCAADLFHIEWSFVLLLPLIRYLL